jgi:hypothetical protein
MNYLGYLTLSYVLYLRSRPSSKAFDGPLSYRCRVILELDGLSSNASKLESWRSCPERRGIHSSALLSPLLALAHPHALSHQSSTFQHTPARCSTQTCRASPLTHSNIQGPSQDGRDRWETPETQSFSHPRCIYIGTVIFHPFPKHVFLLFRHVFASSSTFQRLLLVQTRHVNYSVPSRLPAQSPRHITLPVSTFQHPFSS